MRKRFDEELRAMHAELVDILATVSANVRTSVAALIDGDFEAAEGVIATQDPMDERCVVLEEHVLEMMAMQAPVARDLRLLQSAAYISNHLTRMTKLTVNIAKSVCDTAGQRGPQTLYDLIQAEGSLVFRVLDTTLEALENRDTELAGKLAELDEPIDELYKEYFVELAHVHDMDHIEWVSQVVLAGRHLERIADNAVDIGARIVYIVNGRRDERVARGEIPSAGQ